MAIINRLWDTMRGSVKSIDGMPIGQTTQAAVGASKLVLDSGTKTATASSGAATLNKMSGVVTSESLTTASNAAYTLTLTNSQIAAGDLVFVSVAKGTTTQGIPALSTVGVGTGSATIIIYNNGAQAFNGTILISFAVIKAS